MSRYINQAMKQSSKYKTMLLLLLSLDKLTELFLLERSVSGYSRPIIFQRPTDAEAADAEDIHEILNISTAAMPQHKAS